MTDKIPLIKRRKIGLKQPLNDDVKNKITAELENTDGILAARIESTHIIVCYDLLKICLTDIELKLFKINKDININGLNHIGRLIIRFFENNERNHFIYKNGWKRRQNVIYSLSRYNSGENDMQKSKL